MHKNSYKNINGGNKILWMSDPEQEEATMSAHVSPAHSKRSLSRTALDFYGVTPSDSHGVKCGEESGLR